MTEAARYPRNIDLSGVSIDLRRMTPSDQGAVLAFARSVPRHDLLFMPRDITEEKVTNAWSEANERGHIHTILAFEGEAVVGCAGLFTDPHSWSPHVGELRVLVSPDSRHKGLGRVLIQETFIQALALDLKKLIAQMTVDQAGAIAIFEELGFRGEALLKDHVLDDEKIGHDIVILSCDVSSAASLKRAYSDS